MYHNLIGILFSKDGHGLFNMCNNLIGLLFSNDGHGLFYISVHTVLTKA